MKNPADEKVRGAVRDREQEARKQVYERAFDEPPALEGEAAHEPKDERRERGPEEPVGQLPDEHLAQSRRLSEDCDVVIGEEVVV